MFLRGKGKNNIMLGIFCKNNYINLYVSKIDKFSFQNIHNALPDLSVFAGYLTIHSCNFHKLYSLTFDTEIHMILIQDLCF